MAKFRTNHSASKRDTGATVTRVGLFAAIMAAMLWGYRFCAGGSADADSPVYPADVAESEFYYLPAPSKGGQLIQRKYYALSYIEAHEQAEWTAYVLTRERLLQPWVERPTRFESDPLVQTGSADWADYRGSGYDRGHLVPAADMSFSEEAVQETFFMSNISPQARNFNGGIWKELEELTRDWAKQNKKLYVVTGPVLKDPIKGKIGENQVSIPAAYYKVLLDLSEPQLKGIGFILPNEISYEPLHKYAVSIDEVERRTGIDFFPNLMTKTLEDSLEADVNIDLWPFSKTKFKLRTEKWNNPQ